MLTLCLPTSIKRVHAPPDGRNFRRVFYLKSFQKSILYTAQHSDEKRLGQFAAHDNTHSEARQRCKKKKIHMVDGERYTIPNTVPQASALLKLRPCEGKGQRQLELE
jgi:hypothetical protein